MYLDGKIGLKKLKLKGKQSVRKQIPRLYYEILCLRIGLFFLIDKRFIIFLVSVRASFLQDTTA